MDYPAPNWSHRLASAFGTILVQGGFLLLLLYSVPRFEPPAKPEREMTLTLPRLPKVAPLPRNAPSAEANKPFIPLLVLPIMPGVNTPIVPPPSVIPIIPPSAIQGFGQALNNCAPQNYANLPEDQRAKCQRPGAGVAIQELPNLMGSPSHVKDESHWQEELAREQSPTLLPCGGFLNVACFLSKIADGSWTDYGDPRLWPHYAVEQLAPEDFYKIEKEYDDWHKDHSGAPTGTANPAPTKSGLQ